MWLLNLKNRFFQNLEQAPTFMIIGVQKGGTTTLYDILSGLKHFSGSSIKEVHFFDNDISYKKGLTFYHSFFNSGKSKIKFEATPSYIYYKSVPERIYKYNKKMKFLVIFREPVSRCFSHWNMFRSFNKNKVTAQHIYDHYIRYSNIVHRDSMRELLFTDNFPSFEESIKEDIERYNNNSPLEEPSFVRRGIYHEQITRYLQYFDLSQFLFLEQNEFISNLDRVFDKISSFLSLANRINFYAIDTFSNKGEYSDIKKDDSKSTISFLRDFYAPHNETLFKLIGQRYDW